MSKTDKLSSNQVTVALSITLALEAISFAVDFWPGVVAGFAICLYFLCRAAWSKKKPAADKPDLSVIAFNDGAVARILTQANAAINGEAESPELGELAALIEQQRAEIKRLRSVYDGETDWHDLYRRKSEQVTRFTKRNEELHEMLLDAEAEIKEMRSK